VRQLTYVDRGRVEWLDVPEPALDAPTSAIVGPLAVARCDLDLPMAKLGLFPGPFPVGHEIAAEVIDVGGAVTGVRPGDRVVIPFQVSCGTCRPCARGSFAACDTYMAPLGGSFGFGSAGGGHGGGLADRLLVPMADHMLLPAPPSIDVTTLCTLADNVTDGYRTVGPALRRHPGASVLVAASTPGSIALYATAIALALGGEVRYVDRDPDRVDTAERLGATASTQVGPWPRRFDRATVTVDVTGEVDGLAAVVRSTARYGECTSAAVYFDHASPMPLLEMYTNGITFHTSRADARRYLPDVLDLVAAGVFDPLDVSTTVVPWERAAEAWLEPATKLVVVRQAQPTGAAIETNAGSA
jgi:threonine dehydrogenase-like Zn-dependent dehydrogenase